MYNFFGCYLPFMANGCVKICARGAEHIFSPECELAFVGRISNFRELSALLLRRGCFFTSRSHAELLLRGFCEYGDGFFDSVKGDAAAVVFSRLKNRLYLLALGCRTLSYRGGEGRLYFSSETDEKALAEHTCLDPYELLVITPDTSVSRFLAPLTPQKAEFSLDAYCSCLNSHGYENSPHTLLPFDYSPQRRYPVSRLGAELCHAHTYSCVEDGRREDLIAFIAEYRRRAIAFAREFEGRGYLCDFTMLSLDFLKCSYSHSLSVAELTEIIGNREILMRKIHK